MAKQTLSEQVYELSQRLAALEKRLAVSEAAPSAGPAEAQVAHFCRVPEVPERTFGPDVSEGRMQLIRTMSKKWVNGTVLHYHFFNSGTFGGSQAQQNVVRDAFREWKDVGIGLAFEEVQNIQDAEIRIGFKRGDGSWSYLGRDILRQGQLERTMNFGWDLTRTGEIDTAIHEIGHTLGFPHEHQNPNAGIVWDEAAVIAALARPPNNWDEATTRWNIIRKIPPDTVEGSDWDPDSIMHYPFSAGLILEPARYRTRPLIPKAGLSQKDKEQVRFFYPPLEPDHPELKPYRSEVLTLDPGQQKDFVVLPTASRDYNFRTFGASDTVMVLFEDHDGELRYLKGDDDSGTNLNASFKVRLRKGRRYVLRIRLYFSFSTGETAVLMW